MARNHREIVDIFSFCLVLCICITTSLLSLSAGLMVPQTDAKARADIDKFFLVGVYFLRRL